MACASCAAPTATPASVAPASVAPAPAEAHPFLVQASDGPVRPLIMPRRMFPPRRRVDAHPILVSTLSRWIDEDIEPPTGRSLEREHLEATSEIEAREDKWIGRTSGIGLTSSVYEWGIIRSGPFFGSFRATRDPAAAPPPGLDIAVLESEAQIVWEGVKRDPTRRDGARWQYVQNVGVYDSDRRTVSLRSSRAVDIDAIVDERLFAFVRCASSTCDPWELELVAPSADLVERNGADRRQLDGRLTVTIQPGSSNTFVLFSTDARQEPIVIEIQQSTSEREPVVTAFTGG